MRRVRLPTFKAVLDAIVLEARRDEAFDMEGLMISSNPHQIAVKVAGGSSLCSKDVLGSLDVTPLDTAAFHALRPSMDAAAAHLRLKGLASPVPVSVEAAHTFRRWIRFFCALLLVAAAERSKTWSTLSFLCTRLRSDHHRPILARLMAVTGEGPVSETSEDDETDP
jgi:hypothetical protein